MEYIAFDAHRHYTLASVARPDGQLIREERIEHDRGSLREFLERCERGSPVAVETIGNWYWIVDEIEAAGCVLKLVHARKAKLMMGEINKTDRLDARGSTGCSATARCPQSGFRPASCGTSATCRGPGWCSSGSARSSRIGFTPPCLMSLESRALYGSSSCRNR
jgi:hypothetical protein